LVQGFLRRHFHGGIAIALATAMMPGLVRPAVGQGAVDPNVAPRAAALERNGDWIGATEMLGRYLATAPGDGRAWFQFGRMYLLAAREWHVQGHTGHPDGALYLDLAAIAFDNSIDLQIDSGRVYRGAVEMERGLLRMELSGWNSLLAGGPAAPLSVPGFVLELGANLVASCPSNAVLMPGSQLESLAAWLASVELGLRRDVFPLLPDRFQNDSVYRRQVTVTLEMAVPAELASAAVGRTLCLTPFADSSIVDGEEWSVTQLALVTGTAPARPEHVLTITQLQRSHQQRPTAWTEAVTAVYLQAARRNILLCGGLLSYLKDPAITACGR